MHVLRAVLLGIILTMSMTATAFVPRVSAHPPQDSDHGVNETTFHTLWSGDDDRYVNESAYLERTGESRTALEALANATDIPLDVPPKAIEFWNRGEFTTLPETNETVSIAPSSADRVDGDIIRDAFVSIFAIQPSTRAYLSTADRPLYVGDEGEVLAVADYRVALPPSANATNASESWEIASAAIENISLLVDGQRENTTTQTSRPTLGFDQLSEYPGESHTLTVEAEINVTVSHHREWCLNASASIETCSRRSNETTITTERLPVEDSRTVLEYDLTVRGFETQYPDGDVGLVLYRDRPWLGFQTPAGTVRGSWRFFSARNEQWDTLLISGEDSSTVHSPAHPLQVYAYPIESGSSTTEPLDIEVLASYGVEMDAPTLPENVRLDSIEGEYNASYGLAVRVDADASAESIRAQGLVRDVETTVGESLFLTIPTVETDLTVTVDAVVDGIATVTITLQTVGSGRPIDTSTRKGYVILDGTRVETGPDGTVTREIPVDSGIVTARYEPAPWWEQAPGYVSDSDLASTTESSIDVVNAVFQIGVPASLLLFAAFLVDRITGIPVWPPWRR